MIYRNFFTLSLLFLTLYVTVNGEDLLKCYKCKGWQCNRKEKDIAKVDCSPGASCWKSYWFGYSMRGCGQKRCALNFLSLGRLFSSQCCNENLCNRSKHWATSGKVKNDNDDDEEDEEEEYEEEDDELWKTKGRGKGRRNNRRRKIEKIVKTVVEEDKDAELKTTTEIPTDIIFDE
ncbi:hypothetical protein SNEBB_007017 [Seison nebaliae]|nr:hypothetical protein SNEBB_007017 [Seison nebaliae]